MSFETYTLHVVTLVDPYEKDRYNEAVDEDAQRSVIENIYKITGKKEDYINRSIDGELIWRSVKYYDTDSVEAMEKWKNNLYKVSTRRCAHISVEEHVEDFGSYRYDGLKSMDTLIAWMQHIPKHQRPHVLDIVLIGIPARRWVVHLQPYQE